MIEIPAFAKVNLDLRVVGQRADGYHDLRTVFQTIALHDTVVVKPARGPLALTCTDPAVPADRRNLAWKAASLVWRRLAGRRGDPTGVAIHIHKRIPAEAGLGGGSADAAAVIVALAALWQIEVDAPTVSRLAARLGADVPFLAAGGTSLGLGRGDDLYPLAELPRAHLVVVRPDFGVATVDAYRWFDEAPARRRAPAARRVPGGWPAWVALARNDLEPVVTRRHVTIGRLTRALADGGAVMAAMSGSGSAVFGLFERADAARRAARDLARPGWQVMATRTLTRAEHARRWQRALAGVPRRRIS